MAQLQVKNYLERHKVGSLFEDLMARLIRDQPEDPLAYIRNAVQRKLEQRDGVQAQTTAAVPTLSQTLPSGSVQRSNSSASDSEKAKRGALAKTQPVPSSGGPRQSISGQGSKPPSAASSATNLEELFAGTRSMKRDAKNEIAVSKSTTAQPSRPAAVQLDISEEALAKWAPQQVGPINIGYSGPVKREKTHEESELPVAKPAKQKKEQELTPDLVKDLKSHKKSNQEGKPSQSKAELAKMIAEMEAQERESQAQLRALQAQSVRPHRDDAAEISEDDDALAKEGVSKKSDESDEKKKNKKKKSKSDKKENAQVKLALCKICARMLDPQDEAAAVPASSRVVWTGQPQPGFGLPSARAPLLDAGSANQPKGAQAAAAAASPSAAASGLPPSARPGVSQTLPANADGRTQFEILQDLRLSLGLTAEDLATGRASPYWKGLQSDVSDVDESPAASARAQTRAQTASSRNPRQSSRTGQDFFNK